MAMKAHPKAESGSESDRHWMSMNRRSLLKSSALLSAAFAIPGCFAEEVEGVHGSSRRTLSETQMFAVATLRAAPVV